MKSIMGIKNRWDAFAALWTAERVYTGDAQVIPVAPPRDSQDLFMEIVA